jgi:hypothetical protein
MNQRGGKRNGTARVARSGLIVGSPLRELSPVVFERSKRADKGKNVRGQKKEESLDVVA